MKTKPTAAQKRLPKASGNRMEKAMRRAFEAAWWPARSTALMSVERSMEELGEHWEAFLAREKSRR